jgi:tRNA modification GTPase
VVRGFLAAHFSGEVSAGRAVHGTMRDGAAVIDDPVVVFDAARSLADVSLHGGAWVVRAFLELARREGFEIVDRAEAPLDEAAVDASSPLEAEVLAHLPLARTELALRVLLAQSRAWADLKRRAAWEREAPAEPRPSVEPRGSAAASPSRSELGQILDDRALYWLLHPPRVALVGPANAGKSTLANRLFAQERSITADLPGTTRDWVGEVANLDGLAVMLVDTPGLRETTDTIEANAIALANGQIRRADLVVLVLDATQPLEPEQAELLTRFPDAIRVVNKVDRPFAFDAATQRAINTVATTGQGLEELRGAIRGNFECEHVEIDRARWWTDRQRALLRRARVDPTALNDV